MTLPYPELDGTHTAGWSGSDASHDRAVTEATAGISEQRQAIVLELLARRRSHGATWREVAAQTGWHHGQASGALSVLHKAGRIARLSHVYSRDRCSVYVLPADLMGRLDVPYRDRAIRTAAMLEAARKTGWSEGWADAQRIHRRSVGDRCDWGQDTEEPS